MTTTISRFQQVEAAVNEIIQDEGERKRRDIRSLRSILDIAIWVIFACLYVFHMYMWRFTFQFSVAFPEPYHSIIYNPLVQGILALASAIIVFILPYLIIPKLSDSLRLPIIYSLLLLWLPFFYTLLAFLQGSDVQAVVASFISLLLLCGFFVVVSVVVVLLIVAVINVAIGLLSFISRLPMKATEPGRTAFLTTIMERISSEKPTVLQNTKWEKIIDTANQRRSALDSEAQVVSFALAIFTFLLQSLTGNLAAILTASTVIVPIPMEASPQAADNIAFALSLVATLLLGAVASSYFQRTFFTYLSIDAILTIAQHQKDATPIVAPIMPLTSPQSIQPPAPLPPFLIGAGVVAAVAWLLQRPTRKP